MVNNLIFFYSPPPPLPLFSNAQLFSKHTIKYNIFSPVRIYMQMKITPLLLFFILLFTLVLSSIFSKYAKSYYYLNTENFVNFNYDTNPLNYVYVPQYSSSSSSVVKLYDNLLYDTTNGNVIEINGVPLNGNTSSSSSSFNINNIDRTGLSVSDIYVITRDGNQKINKYTTTCSGNVLLDGNLICSGNTVTAVDTDESKIPVLSVQTDAWYYITQSSNTDKYMICYIPSYTSTFIHIINSTTKKHVSSFLFKDSEIAQTYTYNDNISINVGKSLPDKNPYNGFLVIEPLYDINHKILQISSTVKFDLKNGYLIVNSQNGLDVYNRYGNKVLNKTTRETSFAKTIFQPWIVSDNANNMIIYMQDQNSTLIAYITMISNQFALTNVFYIDATDNFIELPDDYSNVPSNFKDADFKKILEWLTKQATTSGEDTKNNDYILKSQIVPPVCPSCPACPSFNGSCVNCKNLTNDTKKEEKKIDDENKNSNALLSISLNNKSNTNTNTNTSTSTSNINSNNSNSGLPSNTLTPKNTNNKAFTEAGTTGPIPGINNYSQYGASSSTPSNFIPITADFSTFGN